MKRCFGLLLGYLTSISVVIPLLVWIELSQGTGGLVIHTTHSTGEESRRDALGSFGSLGGVSLVSSLAFPPEAAQAEAPSPLPSSLAAKLSKRDASVLRNAVFNLPPPPQVYPPFLRGEWSVEARFRGFLFPSTKVSRERLVANPLVPGFQKCSIANVCDVGRPLAQYRMRIDPVSGLEDRAWGMAQVVQGYLGYDAVDQVRYDAQANPNRISIQFVKNKTRNAERIELFCNARENELVVSSPTDTTAAATTTFVCSEYIRQVTFSLSQEFGVARQVNGNYAHFWTWRAPSESQDGDTTTITGNLLTTAYLDPQDPLYFDEPSKPVAVYSHDLTATKII